MVALEYALTATNEVKQATIKQIAENVTPLLADGQEIFIGTTEELAGKRLYPILYQVEFLVRCLVTDEKSFKVLFDRRFVGDRLSFDL